MLDYLSMVVMAIFWGGTWVSGKLSITTVPAEIVAFLRFLVAGIVLLVILAVKQPDGFKVAKRDWPVALGLGLSGTALYSVLFFIGLRYTPSSDGALIVPTLTPVVTLLVAPVLLGESLTRRKAVGAVISLAGQSMIFWALLTAMAHDPARLKGDLIFFAAMFVWVAFGLLGRVAAKRFTPLASTTWGTITGLGMLLPLALWRFPGSHGYTVAFWANILYLGLLGTVVGFFLWIKGIARLGAGRASVFMNLVPIFTLIEAFLILNERPGLLQVLGMLVVLSGVYVTQSTIGGRAIKAGTAA